MIKVTAVKEIMNVGSTIPLRVMCSDNRLYVLKGINKNAPTGKHLFNELVAYRFGKLIDLDMPPAKTGLLGKSFKSTDSGVDLSKFKFQYGECFLSEYMEGTSLPIKPVTVKYITNIDIVPKLILFDTILMNTDRDGNYGNWFRVKKDNKLIAIDQTNIFRLAQIWDQVSLRQDMTNPPKIIDEINGEDYHILMKEYERRITKKNQHLHSHQHPFSAVKRDIKKITNNQISSCFNGIPTGWKISNTEIKAAYDFLVFQTMHIDDIILELESLFCV